MTSNDHIIIFRSPTTSGVVQFSLFSCQLLQSRLFKRSDDEAALLDFFNIGGEKPVFTVLLPDLRHCRQHLHRVFSVLFLARSGTHNQALVTDSFQRDLKTFLVYTSVRSALEALPLCATEIHN